MCRGNVPMYRDRSSISILPILWFCRSCKLNPPFYSEVPKFAKKYKRSAGDLSYYTVYATKFEIVRQKLRETLIKMLSCDNNIKRAVHLVIIARLLYTIPTVFHHLNPTDISVTSYLAT